MKTNHSLLFRKSLSHRTHRASYAVVGLASALLSHGSAIAHDSGLLTHRLLFNIAAHTTLESALIQWSRKTGVQLMMSTKDIAHLMAPPLNGVYDARAALEVLLHGSGLTYAQEGDTIYILAPNSSGSHRARTSAATATTGTNRTPDPYETLAHRTESFPRISPRSNVARAMPEGEGQQTETLQQVVVTAEKITEKAIDVPMALSVISGQQLAELGATHFSDWANTVPGITFNTVGPGLTQIVIRGITTGAADIGSTVATYFDDVPFGSSTSFGFNLRVALDPSLFDIGRIEVLKGPQGTLYGASSMGGVIKYVTTPPDLARRTGYVTAGGSTTADGSPGYVYSGAYNMPLIQNTLAVRVNAFENHEGGYIDNIARNAKDVNHADTYGGRIDLLYTPSARASLRLEGFAQNLTRGGESTADYALSGMPDYGSLDQFRRTAEPFGQQFRLLSAKANYDFSYVHFTSTSSYQRAATDMTLDYSPIYLAVLKRSGLPSTSAGFFEFDGTNKFTEEMHLTSVRSRFVDWLLGIFYTHEATRSITESVRQSVTGASNVGDLDNNYTPSTYQEYAAFGDVTVHVTPKFDVTGGVRESHNDQRISNAQTGLFSTGKTQPSTDSAATIATYLANARYHFTPSAMAYFRYATGYRPGGPNYPYRNPLTQALVAVPSFSSDKLSSYEAGVKAETSDRRLEADVDIYNINWKDIQLDECNVFCFVTNASGGARVLGSEFSVTARPVNSIALRAAAGYTHAYLRDNEPAIGGSEGERLPNVPEFTGSVTADYTVQDSLLKPTVGATITYVDSRWAAFNKSVGSHQYSLPTYTLLGLHAGMLIFSGMGNLQVYVENALNRPAELSAYTFNGPRPAIEEPRTIGIRLTDYF